MNGYLNNGVNLYEAKPGVNLYEAKPNAITRDVKSMIYSKVYSKPCYHM